ncbi:biopolymer transporter ExbD [Marinobacter sp.]|uniref:ExbD/TolR family protein n=1 Tax=Marinobacter sp. TaxID=50741 RepID=UPI002B4744D0|nr:biopolymer transporter ExbD [Marinobacter sp.]HKK54773.1 biopolymer transporter ExbD [Marinobacter sp.]
MKFKRQRSQEVGVDLTPLIDVVFLLLIFFMVSTTFTRENHLNIELPEASGERSEQQAEMIDVVINADGQYRLNNRVLVNNRRETLVRAVTELADGDASLPFIITADARTPHEFVVRAMDVAGSLGFASLSITTERQGESE